MEISVLDETVGRYECPHVSAWTDNGDLHSMISI